MEAFNTPRLRVRPLVPADLAALYDLYRQPELMQYVTGAPRTYAQTEAILSEHLADHARYGFGLCALILRENDQMIGRGGLLPAPAPGGVEGELAFLIRKEYWNRGLATEFAQAMIAYGFAQLHLPRIFATVDLRNTASCQVLENAGMHRVRSGEREAEYEILAPVIRKNPLPAPA